MKRHDEIDPMYQPTRGGSRPWVTNISAVILGGVSVVCLLFFGLSATFSRQSQQAARATADAINLINTQMVASNTQVAATITAAVEVAVWTEQALFETLAAPNRTPTEVIEVTPTPVIPPTATDTPVPTYTLSPQDQTATAESEATAGNAGGDETPTRQPSRTQLPAEQTATAERQLTAAGTAVALITATGTPATMIVQPRTGTPTRMATFTLAPPATTETPYPTYTPLATYTPYPTPTLPPAGTAATGRLEISYPLTVVVEEDAVVTVEIIADQALSQLGVHPEFVTGVITMTIVSGDAVRGRIEDTIKLYPVMYAELIGINFDIIIGDMEPKRVIDANTTSATWTWTISGKNVGSHILTVNVFGELLRNGEQATELVRVKPFEVEVKARPLFRRIGDGLLSNVPAILGTGGPLGLVILYLTYRMNQDAQKQRETIAELERKNKELERLVQEASSRSKRKR